MYDISYTWAGTSGAIVTILISLLASLFLGKYLLLFGDLHAATA